MNPKSFLIAVTAVVVVGFAGFVVGFQTQQQHDLGLEQTIPEIQENAPAPYVSPPNPDFETTAFRIVDEQDGFLVVELLIYDGNIWRPAKIRDSGAEFRYAGGE